MQNSFFRANKVINFQVSNCRIIIERNEFCFELIDIFADILWTRELLFSSTGDKIDSAVVGMIAYIGMCDDTDVLMIPELTFSDITLVQIWSIQVDVCPCWCVGLVINGPENV